MESQKYTDRLGMIAPAQLQAALDRFDLGKLLEAEAAPGGLFGQNLFVTSTAGQFVLRGCAHSDTQFLHEQFFARLLHEQTAVPVPWPYLVDVGKDIFGWGYVLMPRMPGRRVCDVEGAELELPARIALARALGTTLAESQRVTWPVLASQYDLETHSLRPHTMTHYERIADHILDSMATACKDCPESTTPDDVAWVKQLLQDARDAFELPFTPCFVHHDLNGGNITVEADGDQWRVTGVFDLGETYFGDGEEGLPRYLCGLLDTPDVAHAYITSYTTLRPPRPGFDARLPIYYLADRLVIWAYGHSLARWFDPALKLRACWEEGFKLCTALSK